MLSRAAEFRDATQPGGPIHLRSLLAALVAVWPADLEQAGGDAAALRDELLAAIAERAPEDDQDAWRGLFTASAAEAPSAPPRSSSGRGAAAPRRVQRRRRRQARVADRRAQRRGRRRDAVRRPGGEGRHPARVRRVVRPVGEWQELLHGAHAGAHGRARRRGQSGERGRTRERVLRGHHPDHVQCLALHGREPLGHVGGAHLRGALDDRRRRGRTQRGGRAPRGAQGPREETRRHRREDRQGARRPRPRRRGERARCRRDAQRAHRLGRRSHTVPALHESRSTGAVLS